MSKNFQTLSADLESEPITGYLHTGQRLYVPLISHIVDNLYVGGHSETADLGDFFTHVFSLYVWGSQYIAAEGVVHASFRMYDSPDEDPTQLDEFVTQVVEALDAGGNVLLHCQAGINRSNLLATLALRKWKGMTSKDAIALLREKRSPLVLANRSFEDYLNSL